MDYNNGYKPPSYPNGYDSGASDGYSTAYPSSGSSSGSRSASGSPPGSPQQQPSEQSARAQADRGRAKLAYASKRYKHGTDKQSKDAIRQSGFDTRRKTGGATATLGIDPNDPFAQSAARNNYFTQNGEVAKAYANTQQRGQPSMVRTYMDPYATGLENDPDSMPQHLAYRTAQPVAAGYVLPSSRQRPDPNSAAVHEYRNTLIQHGYPRNTTLQQAADILHDVQSASSGDDFSTARRMGAG